MKDYAMSNKQADATPIRVMIVDDHKMLRHALAIVLNNLDDMILVGETASGAESVELCTKVYPDVVLMDLGMDGVDGVAATRAIRNHYQHIQVLIFTSFRDADKIQAALQAGAEG